MKTAATAIILAALFIGGVIVFSGRNSTADSPVVPNVSIVAGKQIIEVKARGGFQPKKSVAKAGWPTILRFDTNGTFDCSSSVRIPSLNISQTLPPSGTTDIDLGNPQVATVYGTCGMGMYPFEIEFRS